MKIKLVISFAIFFAILLLPLAHAEEYEVTQPVSLIRGDVWLSDAGAYLRNTANDSTGGNRFRLGVEMNLGSDYQFLLGLTLLDILATGETSPDTGGISRAGVDFDLGYFVIPDKLWIKYSFHIEDVRGGFADGDHSALGYGASIGWRFFNQSKCNLNLELSYLYIQEKTVSTFNIFTGVLSTMTFPAANIVSLGLQVGFEIGGR